MMIMIVMIMIIIMIMIMIMITLMIIMMIIMIRGCVSLLLLLVSSLLIIVIVIIIIIIMIIVSTEVTFGRGDLRVCPLESFTGAHEYIVSNWRGQGQTLRALLLRGTSVLR